MNAAVERVVNKVRNSELSFNVLVASSMQLGLTESQVSLLTSQERNFKCFSKNVFV